MFSSTTALLGPPAFLQLVPTHYPGLGSPSVWVITLSSVAVSCLEMRWGIDLLDFVSAFGRDSQLHLLSVT